MAAEQGSLDPAKNEKTLAERGLDFADAALVFVGVTLEVEDTPRNYGETRIICYGLLEGRVNALIRTALRPDPGFLLNQ